MAANYGYTMRDLLHHLVTTNQDVVATTLRMQRDQHRYENGRYVEGAWWVANKQVDWVDVDADGEMFSFVPGGIPDLGGYNADGTYNDPFTHPKRQKGRIGRVVRKMLTEEGAKRVTNDDLERFVSRVRAWKDALKGAEFRLVQGDDIARYYRHPNTMVQSCMQGARPDAFDLYTRNTKVHLLVMVMPEKDGEPEEMLARSLVWQTEEHGFYQDSVYAATQRARRAMVDEANRRWPDQPDPHGAMRVKVEEIEFSAYPYLDTFRYYHPATSTLCADWVSGAQNVDGMGHPPFVCDGCGWEGDLDDAHYFEYDENGYCNECYDERACGHCGEWAGRHNDYCDHCREHYVCTDCGEDTRFGTTDGYCGTCLPNHTCKGCEAVHHEDDLEDGVCAECRPTFCESCETVADDVVTFRHMHHGEMYGWRSETRDWGMYPYSYEVTTVRCLPCERERLSAALARAAAKWDATLRETAIIHA